MLSTHPCQLEAIIPALQESLSFRGSIFRIRLYQTLLQKSSRVSRLASDTASVYVFTYAGMIMILQPAGILLYS